MDLEEEMVGEKISEQQPEITSQSELYITSDLTSMATSLQAVTRAATMETMAREMDKYPLQELAPEPEPEQISDQPVEPKEEILAEEEPERKHTTTKGLEHEIETVDKVEDTEKRMEEITEQTTKLLETEAIPEIEDKELEAETLQEEVPEPIPEVTVQSRALHNK